MSRVTNAILVAHLSARGTSDPEIDSVNKFLREREDGGGGEFIEVTPHAGGTKHMECRIYRSAFNHADTEVILHAVDQAPWRDKDAVQVFVREQEEDGFFTSRQRPSLFRNDVLISALYSPRAGFKAVIR